MQPNEDQAKLIAFLKSNGVNKDHRSWSVYLRGRRINSLYRKYSFVREIVDLYEGQTLRDKLVSFLYAESPSRNCIHCGNPLPKNTVNIFCSRSCSLDSPVRRANAQQTMMDRYGVLNPLENANILAKMQNTNLARYGVQNVSQVKKVKEKKEKTFLTRYGVASYIGTAACRQQSRATLLKRYGVDHPSKSAEIRERKEEKFKTKYGVSNPLLLPTSIKSKDRVFVEKYGDKSYLKTPLGKKIFEETCFNKYGVKHPSGLELVRNKVKATNLVRYGVDHPSKSKIVAERRIKAYRKSFYDSLTAGRLGDSLTPLFTKDEYKGRNICYKFRCNVCETEFKSHLDDGKIPRCPTCYPPMRGTSKGEEEVATFLAQYTTVERHNRSVLLLNGQELDIYLPEYNMAVEYNGNYWHSQIGGNKERYYHQKKALACYESGVKLFSIFSDQWEQKQELISNMLLQRLGKTDTCVGARKCKIVPVNSETARLFFNENHLFGAVNGVTRGLEYEGQIVAALSIGKSRYDKSYSHELLRFAVKQRFSVQGGLSRLLKAFSFESLVCYADASFSTGTAYELVGFNRVGITAPGYHYLDSSYSHRYSRQQFQKHKLQGRLERYFPERSEWENMQLNGYDRVWDCGNWVFVKPGQ